MRTDDGEAFGAALVAARRGSSAGLSLIFRELHPALLRYLRAREPRAADDLAGDTWLAVAQRINTFEGDRQAFVAWLFTIARHRLTDFRRSSSRRGTAVVSLVVPNATEPTAEHVALANLSAQAAVDTIVRLLSSDQAEVVLLRVLGDLSLAQIARIMDRDVVWVGVTLHRGLKRLENRLGVRVLVTT